MKKRVSRDMVLFLILIPMFLAGAFYISSRAEKNLPSYTVNNKSRDGYSVFYETLKELGHPVERTMTPIQGQSFQTVQIVSEGGSFNINSNEIKEWVKEGGNIVYLTYKGVAFFETASVPERKGAVTIYNFGEGKIIVGDALALTNNALLKDKDKAYEIYKEISGLVRPIYFNEGYIYSQENKLSLWDYIPMDIKFIIYQLLLVLAAFFYYKGKRFGKPVPLYEEEERSENEYVYSAASLYRVGKCFDLMVENYYHSLLRELKCTPKDFLSTWEKEELPYLNKAEKVFKFIDTGAYKKRSKECIRIISLIEQLRKIVIKRRDSYWKTFKKI